MIWLLILVVAAGAWSAGARAARRATSPAARPVAAPAKPIADQQWPLSFLDELPDPAHVDLYGNEVEPAVTDYRIDFRGDLYESHSPETAVTALAAPVL